jgi:hypothetical protein
MYNNLPVRGWLHTPSNPSAPPNAIVLFHPTIETDGTTPVDAAQRFIDSAIDSSRFNLGGNILFSCAPLSGAFCSIFR